MNNDVENKKNRGLLIGLLALIGVLIIAVFVLIFLQMSGNSGNNPADPSTNEPGTTEPDPNAPKPAVISSFVADSNSALCPLASEDYEGDVNFSWQISNAKDVALAIASTEVDATTVPGIAGLKSSVSGFNDLRFPCAEESIVYSLTAVGEDGSKATKTITIERELAQIAAPTLTSATWTDGTDYVICPSFSGNEKVKKSVTWDSSSVGEVKLYLARSESTYPKNSETHKLVASGLPVSGSYEVTIDCGNSGYSSYFSVMIRIENSEGLKNLFVKGNTAS